MSRFMWMLLLAITLAQPLSSARAADIQMIGGGGGPCSAFILGQIESEDDEKFRRATVGALREKCSSVGSVYVYSPGGDVHAAMSIGQQIRLLEAQTWGPTPDGPHGSRTDAGRWCILPPPPNKPFPQIRYNAQKRSGDERCSCHSACFLIWAGGVSRYGHAIGLHRPRFDSSTYGKLSTIEAAAKYQAMNAMVRTYLLDLGVPETIINKMMSVDSQNVQYLTYSEFQLLAEIPYLEELLLAKCKKQVNAPTRWSSECAWKVVAEMGTAAAKRYLERYSSK